MSQSKVYSIFVLGLLYTAFHSPVLAQPQNNANITPEQAEIFNRWTWAIGATNNTHCGIACLDAWIASCSGKRDSQFRQNLIELVSSSLGDTGQQQLTQHYDQAFEFHHQPNMSGYGRKTICEGSSVQKLRIEESLNYSAAAIHATGHLAKDYVSAKEHTLAQTARIRLAALKTDATIKQAIEKTIDKAALGDVEAMYLVGAFYERIIPDTNGSAPDYEGAFDWYERAARQKHRGASYALGVMFTEGKVSDTDIDQYRYVSHWTLDEVSDREGARFLKVAADAVVQGDDPPKEPRNDQIEAIGKLAFHYMKYGYNQYAFAWASAVEDFGHPDALLVLGTLHYTGHQPPRDKIEPNIPAALDYFFKASARGSCRAMMNIAGIHFNGDDVERDLDEARKWFNAAKECDQSRTEVTPKSDKFIGQIENNILPPKGSYVAQQRQLNEQLKQPIKYDNSLLSSYQPPKKATSTFDAAEFTANTFAFVLTVAALTPNQPALEEPRDDTEWPHKFWCMTEYEEIPTSFGPQFNEVTWCRKRGTTWLRHGFLSGCVGRNGWCDGFVKRK